MYFIILNKTQLQTRVTKWCCQVKQKKITKGGFSKRNERYLGRIKYPKMGTNCSIKQKYISIHDTRTNVGTKTHKRNKGGAEQKWPIGRNEELMRLWLFEGGFN